MITSNIYYYITTTESPFLLKMIFFNVVLMKLGVLEIILIIKSSNLFFKSNRLDDFCILSIDKKGLIKYLFM